VSGMGPVLVLRTGVCGGWEGARGGTTCIEFETADGSHCFCDHLLAGILGEPGDLDAALMVLLLPAAAGTTDTGESVPGQDGHGSTSESLGLGDEAGDGSSRGGRLRQVFGSVFRRRRSA
jgi:hypothetical protein